jgi:hypothetical protein
MQKLYLPHVILPTEFVTLLKTNIAVTTTSAPIFDVIRPNQAIYCVLENAFKEFDDGRGLEKTMIALGWSNFRDRMASIYVYKAIYGEFPSTTSMDLVDEIKQLEHRFSNHGVHSFSRLFLLGFYLKMASLESRRRQNNEFIDIKIPEELGIFLKISQGRSERIDWLILITLHLLNGLGDKLLMNALISGKKFEDLYPLLNTEIRQDMLNNLLAYGASIGESDVFLYEKI